MDTCIPLLSMGKCKMCRASRNSFICVSTWNWLNIKLCSPVLHTWLVPVVLHRWKFEKVKYGFFFGIQWAPFCMIMKGMNIWNEVMIEFSQGIAIGEIAAEKEELVQPCLYCIPICRQYRNIKYHCKSRRISNHQCKGVVWHLFSYNIMAILKNISDAVHNGCYKQCFNSGM